MNTRHRKTLEAIFASTTPATMEWRRIEALFVALGAEVEEGDGSRVGFVLNGAEATFHRPHPRKDALRLTIRDARDFLIRAGVIP